MAKTNDKEQNAETNTYYSQNSKITSDYIDYILLSLVGMNILCIIFIIGCYRRCNNVKKQINNKIFIDNVNEQIEKLKSAIEVSNSTHNNKSSNVPKHLSFPCPYYNKDAENDIVCNKNHNQNTTSQKKQENKEEQGTNIIELTKKLYASQWSTTENTFCSVLDKPNDSTVYELEIRGEIVEFYLYNGAINKVLGASGFLEFATDFQFKNDNPSTAKTETKGKATKNANGKWVIEKKMVLIFE